MRRYNKNIDKETIDKVSKLTTVICHYYDHYDHSNFDEKNSDSFHENFHEEKELDTRDRIKDMREQC